MDIPGTFLEYATQLMNDLPKNKLNAYAYGSVNVDENAKAVFSSNPNYPLASGKSAEDQIFNEVEVSVLALSLPAVWGIHNGLHDQPAVGYSAEGAPFVLTDCSGFMNHLVSTVNQSADAVINAENKFCLAEDYANNNFKNKALWKSTFIGGSGVYPLKAGDILCWRLNSESVGNTGTGSGSGASDTGHVMLIAEDATLTADGRVHEVNVLDCSDIKHKNDNRVNGYGVGCGSITLQCDEAVNSWIVSVEGTASISPYNRIDALSQLQYVGGS
ncbi:MAG: hypothetical protein ACFB10_04430 [Salibacteraceae bacterium]